MVRNFRCKNFLITSHHCNHQTYLANFRKPQQKFARKYIRMATFTALSALKPLSFCKPKQTHFSSQRFHLCVTKCTKTSKPIIGNISLNRKCKKCIATLFGTAGLALATALLGSSYAAAELPSLAGSSLQFTEPANALSLPTWAIHVSSVVEWITAMALVWQYGEKTGYETWKGLSWGMVPLLGGAFCACTWHFFYNAESLEVLVVLQAALTVIGNVTICIAAFRIFKSSEERSRNL